MSDHAVASTPPQDLRARAATQLTGGVTRLGSLAGAANALAVLHALAASPATAADALALLHELQVHQVELDLQAQELRESRAELEAALRRLIERHDFLPVGCFSLDRSLIVRELNQTGARLLGLERDAACGLDLRTLFSARSIDRLQALALRAGRQEPVGAIALEWRPEQAHRPVVQAHLALDPAGEGWLLVLTPAAGEPAPPSAP